MTMLYVKCKSTMFMYNMVLCAEDYSLKIVNAVVMTQLVNIHQNMYL